MTTRPEPSERTPQAIDWEAIHARLRVQQVGEHSVEDLAEIFARRAVELAKAAATQQAATVASHLCCSVRDVNLLLPIQNVLRIVRPDGATVVPGTPPLLRRIMHAEGSVVAIADLSHIFQQHAADGDAAPELVVLLGHGKERLALAVDKVRGLSTVDESVLTPAARNRSGSEFVVGLGPQLELVLDAVRLIYDLNVSGKHRGEKE